MYRLDNDIIFQVQLPSEISEVEDGLVMYQNGYQKGLISFVNRLNNKLSQNIIFNNYKMNNNRPMISFTFDDVSQSAALIGGDILEKENVKGSYYISTSLTGRNICGSKKANQSEILALQKMGHEIGLHSHLHLPVFAMTKEAFYSDLLENKRNLQEIVGKNHSMNYCYPYGVTSLQHKLFLKNRVRSARVLSQNINKNSLDPFALKSQLLDSDCITDEGLLALLKNAKETNGWLIFISHQVYDIPNKLTTTTAMLKRAIKLSKELGFDQVSIDQGLDRLNIPKMEK